MGLSKKTKNDIDNNYTIGYTFYQFGGIINDKYQDRHID
jgi:hypothetical protein